MEKGDLYMLVSVIIIACGMFLIGGASKQFYIRRDAVKATVAYWTVDENGISKFHWITE